MDWASVWMDIADGSRAAVKDCGTAMPTICGDLPHLFAAAFLAPPSLSGLLHEKADYA
jgi:hypothetical protein